MTRIKGLQLPMNDADVIIWRCLFDRQESERFCSQLYQNIAWKHESIKLFGKYVLQPRLTAYYGEKTY
ncbi:MAG: alpha-ketoglutarate-dependent dioxygenase AlkB, partial [Hydrococcus sp. Prado102]|nr:alpha-ketoglutarate-dependent dioxygenase AlkB [Hydrococcus sp. Prado102]